MKKSIEIPKKALRRLKKLQAEATNARVNHSLVIEENNKRADKAMKSVLQAELDFHSFAEQLSKRLLKEDLLNQYNWHLDPESGKIINLGSAPKPGDK